MMTSLARVSVMASLLFVSTGQARGQEPRAQRTTDSQDRPHATKVRHFRETAISPDSKRVGWVENLEGKNGEPSGHSAILVANVEPNRKTPRRISAGDGKEDCAEHSVAWSQDSARIAFLSDHDKEGQLQVYVAQADGGDAQRLTELTGFLADPRWSSDGKTLAFLFTENATQAAGPLQPGAIQTGLVDEQVFEQRLNLIDLESNKVRQVSPADLYVYEYDWSPDGKQCAIIAAHGSGDNNWYIAQLFVLTSETGEIKSILTPKMQIAVPRWSPDGRLIAFIGGLMSDEAVTGGDIYVVPASGGAARNLTPDLPTSATWLSWHPSSQQILFTELIDGSSGLARVNLKADVTHLWKSAERIAAASNVHTLSASASSDLSTLALIRQSSLAAPEVWAGGLGEWQAVTHANEDMHSEWGKTESLHWRSDPFVIQGWLLHPSEEKPGQRYPLVVQVHGGPASAVSPAWLGADPMPATLSRQGYFVLMPNPRGSFGEGERFARANVKDLGYGDLRDIMSGVDEVVRTRPIEKDRVGITGWSYGGYMTMWAVTQTNRFRAAVAGAGICNWQSYYGQNGIDQWLIPYFGASVYDDPAIYARSSPITFIKRVKTPTLILVGERDVECPVPQSQEFHHALKTLNVPTQLMIYSNEGHAIFQPEHRRDIVRRSVEWFDRALKSDRTNQP